MGIEAKNTTSVLRANYEKYLLAYEYFEASDKMASPKLGATDTHESSAEAYVTNPDDSIQDDTADSRQETFNIAPSDSTVDTDLPSSNVLTASIDSIHSSTSLDQEATNTLGCPESVSIFYISSMTRGARQSQVLPIQLLVSV